MASSKLNPYERYFALRHSVDSMVQSSARTVEWVNDRLQEIVDEPASTLEIPGLSEGLVKQLIRFWDKQFPRRGRAIMELIGPFYSPELSFNLKPPVSNLAERVSRAVCWQEVTMVRVVTLANLWDGPRDSLGANLWNSLADSLADNLKVSVRANLWDSLRDSLWDSLRNSLGDNFKVSLEASLKNCLVFAVGFLIVEGTSKDFRPLLELWLSGNLPAVFDEEGRLLVLCAESSSAPVAAEAKVGREVTE